MVAPIPNNCQPYIPVAQGSMNDNPQSYTPHPAQDR
jgi:hypothetical protein